MTESALMKLLLEMLKENCDFGIFDEYYRKVLDGSFDENCVRELTSSEEFSKITESFSIFLLTYDRFLYMCSVCRVYTV